MLRRVAPAITDHRARAVDYGIRGMHLAYDLLDRWDLLVLVDAVPSRGRPGTVHIFEANTENTGLGPGLDAHAMDPAAVFASLAALGGHPPRTVVVGCEVRSVAEGIGLSPAVAAAVPIAVRAVETVVAGRLAPAGPG